MIYRPDRLQTQPEILVVDVFALFDFHNVISYWNVPINLDTSYAYATTWYLHIYIYIYNILIWWS